MSPDKFPVIDSHPRHHNILFAAGFSGNITNAVSTQINTLSTMHSCTIHSRKSWCLLSGRGYMLAPVAAEIVSELLNLKPKKHRIEEFSMSRFKKAFKRGSKL